MSTNLGSFDAPQAVRTSTTGWRDPRLWIGIALVAGSVLIGANLLSSDDDTVEMWAAAHDLAPGVAVSTDDFEIVTVDLAEVTDTYLRADGTLPGDVVQRPVGAGELVPAASLGAPLADEVEVALWAPAVSVPDAVRAGALVDVWVVPDDGESDRSPVLSAVRVVAAPRDGDALGPVGDRQVVVAVPDEIADRIGPLLAAAHDGRIVVTKRG